MLFDSTPQDPPVTADICLILEGTYPYTAGGVSSWTHELIQMQNHLTFTLVSLVGGEAPLQLRYELPPNVVGLHPIRLQQLPKGVRSLPSAQQSQLFAILRQSLLQLQSPAARLQDLEAILRGLSPYRTQLGQRLLLDSRPAWDLLLYMYHTTLPQSSFLDYFWSWRGLFGGLFSLLVAPLPPARMYHSLCTGYGGLLLARAHLETGRPCLVTEHGIYTNERRIEIASADWLNDPHSFSLSVHNTPENRELKDFWTDMFGSYSRFCYEASSRIVTLYEGNQAFQRQDGAEPAKLRIIPNGIDFERYTGIQPAPHPPTIAMIGRVVPIKDVKSYIRAVHLLKKSLPDLRAYMIGPEDEDKQYARECRELVEHLGLTETLIFTGKVAIEDYLSQIDLLVLSSLSEAQPLVILEAGSAGIPCVATHVGACEEMIMGSSHENPALGPGGAIVPLANPRALAEALHRLLADPEQRLRCSLAIRERVRRYYNKTDQYRAYADLYQELIAALPTDPLPPQRQAA